MRELLCSILKNQRHYYVLIKKNGKLKPAHLVDVPGHSRLRPKLDEFLPQATGIVFVVDFVGFLPNCRAASEYLYDILTKATVVKKKIHVLILSNKTDKVTANGKEFIRKQLEKKLSAISTADIADDFTLGVLGKPFSFPQCQNKVKVDEAAGITGNITQVQ
ncbi:putative signal recognition particle receptor, beta subunit [Rosa chinensis]|uniref:Signal recognition particle receptor subunit beta n=1 Tax=Rosa chinensis TaxID=74649 RepID=A0A2P6QFC6_ROSCH|nr:putative signal recognition particle receptor, beta subunit [Rosa chinensis]